jgi:hypothetical protein
MRVKQDGVIFDASAAPPNGRSSAFTSLTRLANGDLLVAFRTATGRDAPDGRLRIMRSRDTGQTWETLHTGMPAIIDGIVGNLYAGFFTEMAQDRLLGAFVWVDRSNPELSFVNPVTAGILPMRALLAESADSGETWGEFHEVDLTPQVGCAVTGPVLSLSGGVLALPYESWKEYDDPSPGRHIASLRLSFDGGKTWPGMVPVAADPDARTFYWDQRFGIHAETGQIVAMFWTHNREDGIDLDNHIAWASADGREWSMPVPTEWRGQHCQPIPIGGDRLVAIYVHRHDPPSLRAVLSDDFGRTWHPDELTFFSSEACPEVGAAGERVFEEFWQDMMAWRFGHPRGLLLPDGDLFVAFYAGNATATSMRWVRIEL